MFRMIGNEMPPFYKLVLIKKKFKRCFFYDDHTELHKCRAKLENWNVFVIILPNVVSIFAEEILDRV